MKTLKITLITLFALASSTLMAQKGERKGENTAVKNTEIEAFLTEKLELTEAEKTAFFPVYNQYKAEKKGLRSDVRAERQKGKKMEDLSDDELDKVIKASFEMKQKELDLKKKYHEKFKQVLPMKKVAKLYHSERQMRSHMKNNRKKGGNPEGKRMHKPAPPTDR